MADLNSYHYHAKISPKTRILNFFRRSFTNSLADGTLAAVMHRLPFLRFFVGKIIPPEYLYKKPSWRLYEKNGIKMKLDISNLVDHFIYFSFEHPAITNFVNCLKDKSVVFDVGANIGYTTLLFSKKCPAGKIISIEPSEKLYKIFTAQLNLNENKNVTPLNIGLGEKRKTARLYQVNEYNSGMNRVLEDSNSQIPSENIEIKTLDDLLAELQLETVNAIKIDVEGYEYNILKGAYKTLKTKQPILLIEIDDFNLKQQQASPKDIFRLLFELNYSVFLADTMLSLDLTKDYTNSHFDIICFPKDHLI